MERVMSVVSLSRRDLGVGVLLVLLVGVVSLLVRPLIPVDETRYISVAWEMWSHGSWYLPVRNFQPYAHKPPLLFWLIQAGWWLLGVNEWWPRMISPLLAAANVLLVASLARVLWPQRPQVGPLAAVVYIGSWYALALSTAMMFDMLMTACVLLAVLGLLRARAAAPGGWPLLVTGIALGLLAKGPVVLVYTVPAALAATYWGHAAAGAPSWYPRLGLALLLACVPIVVWLAAVAHSTGLAELHELVVEQSMARVSGQIGHGRPFWWYLPWLLLIPMPWLLWPALWRNAAALRRGSGVDDGLRFVGVAVCSACLLLSLVGGKQVHYLLPVWALAAPAIARVITLADRRRPGDLAWPLLAVLAVAGVLWLPVRIKDADVAAIIAQVRPWLTLSLVLVCTVGALLLRRLGELRIIQFGSAASLLALFVCAFPSLRERYDLSRPAALIASAQKQGRAVAFVGVYQAEFGFLGRLAAPIATVDDETQAAQWAQLHPDGLLVGRTKRLDAGSRSVRFRQPYRSDELVLVDAGAWRSDDLALHRPAVAP